MSSVHDLSDAAWRKAKRSSDEGACVELAEVSACVAVRDSKDKAGPKLAFSRTAVTAFVDEIKTGLHDL